MVYIKIYFNLESNSIFNYDNVVTAFLTPISIIHLYLFACFGKILNFILNEFNINKIDYKALIMVTIIFIIKILISGGFNSDLNHFILTIVQPLNIRGWL